MTGRQPTLKKIFCLLLVCAAANGPARAAETPAQRAEKAFQETRAQFEKERASSEAAWKFGRACFDWAEFAENNDQREEIANQGIEACRRVVVRQPKAVEGHYYLAMNLGQLARTKTLGALKLVDEMELEFKTASELDAKFDFAGPDRNLGWLYFSAPGWPTSIGSRGKARQHLERAVKLKPDYPENHLNLIEAYLKWGDKNGAQREFNALKQLWPLAKKQFSGASWESNWSDWETRWGKIQTKFSEPAKLIATPHEKK